MPIPDNKVKAPYTVGMGTASHSREQTTGDARTRKYAVPRKDPPDKSVSRAGLGQNRVGFLDHVALHPAREAAVLGNRVGQAPPMTGGHGNKMTTPTSSRVRSSTKR